jgi:acyl-CoA reductase-like NAD-dependent aldehyde dehydrogenase
MGRHPKPFTEADAIKMAKDTEFGLAAHFYSRGIGPSGASLGLEIRHRGIP